MSTDEDGNSLYEFTDMGGRLYLRRTVINGNDADTYFLRNGMGETVAVLTPKLMEEGIDKENVEKYAYLYVYDGRHRISASKTPGSGWKRFRYDAADRLVMEQDANMDETGICKFHIYDRHGRECIVGTCSNGIGDTDWSRNIVSCRLADRLKNTPFGGYDVEGIAIDSPSLLKVNYYDGYGFLELYGDLLTYREEETGTDYMPNPVSRLTGCRKAVVGGNEGAFIASAFYYDERCLPLQTVETNVTGGTDVESFAYTDGAQVAVRRVKHLMQNGKVASEEYDYTYDNAARIKTERFSFEYDGKRVTGPVKEIGYDALGRKADEATTTTSGKILRTKYKYNIMGAIKELDATLFSEELYYEDSAPMRHLPAYNGNVSAMTWRAADDILLQRGYAYYYDGADRLTEAAYFENGNRAEKYGTAYEYDSGGNITRISRDGYAGNGKFETVDELGMKHDGNRLARVIDFGVDSKVNGAFQFRQQNGITEPYAYDANGNLTKDMYKGIDHISYNVMNMPEKLDFKTGESIAYIYDADGNKLGSMYQ